MLIKQNSELIKDNSEFKNMVMEQQNKIFEQQSMVMKVLENGTNNTTITTNSHNKAFNLNFFLNETCKDAMNIMDFVESIKLQLSDLERVGEKGYIEGISNIIIKNLKDLDVTQRPVHCTDKKRETIYVKDEDKWEKDDENKKMHKLVRKIQDKNFRMIQKFKEKYPNYNKASSKQSDVYNNIIIESMGGKGDNDFEKEEKIIKKVSKEIGVGK
jgi:Txe/YoeB family toxin of Txe-Axe toxin-antitoxin module